MKYKYKVGMIMILVVIATLVTSMVSSGLLGLQHKWYDTSEDENQVPCSKCHQNIYDEYETSGNIHYRVNMECEDCHRGETGVTYAVGGSPEQPGVEAHTASIPPCRQCHEYQTTNISHANESHKPLYDTAGLNEACISCHTGFDKSLNFTRALYVEYDLTKNATDAWVIQNFTFFSSNSTIINLAPEGRKHTWENASEIDYCFDCHSDVKSALENGGHVPKSDKRTMGQASLGHQGRHHNFDRGSVTIDSCKSCHLPDPSDFGTSHPEAQLDYHAATTEHCYNCHYNGSKDAPGGGMCQNCHDILGSGDHKDICDNMFLQNFCWYQIDKVCVGCHMPGPDDNVPFGDGDKHFEVYTEPNIIIVCV